MGAGRLRTLLWTVFIFPYSLLHCEIVFFFFLEKGEPRSAGGGQTQHTSQKDTGREDEEADAERGVLEKKRGGGALENGNEVWSWCFLMNGPYERMKWYIDNNTCIYTILGC